MTNAYNGWTNYETWLVNLWLGNEGFFERFRSVNRTEKVMTIEKNTNLLFTETKNGAGIAKSYELTAGEFINIVYEKEVDGRLDVGVEPILDQEGDVVDFTPNKFWELPISKQLDMCCRVEGERYAATVRYKTEVAEGR